MANGSGLSRSETLACLGAGLGAALGLAPFLSPLAALSGGYLIFAMLAIAVIDARLFLIPDALSLPAIPLGLMVSALNGDQDRLAPLDALAGALAGGASFWLIRWGYRRLAGREGLGLGDVKLAMAAGAWLGLDALPIALLLATGAALLVVAVHSMVRREARPTRTTPVPFGSFLAPAVWLAWLYLQLGPAW